MCVAHEAGAHAHTRLRARSGHADGGASEEGHILAGVLGLLSLLMAFSFSLALDRHEQRRTLIVAEANAIDSMDQRIQLLEPGPARILHARRVRYGEARLRADDAPAARARAAADTDALRLGPVLAADTIATLRGQASAPVATLVMQALDDLGNIAVERRALADARLPERVLGLLWLYCIVAALMLGYTLTRTKSPHRLASATFFALLAFAFITILDLDRPRSGGIRIPESALEEAVANLRR